MVDPLVVGVSVEAQKDIAEGNLEELSFFRGNLGVNDGPIGPWGPISIDHLGISSSSVTEDEITEVKAMLKSSTAIEAAKSMSNDDFRLFLDDELEK